MSTDPSSKGQPDEPTWAFRPETPAPFRDLTGTTLGDFAIERRLGRGGMGEVYLARQISLDRPIALKVIRPDLLASGTALARFEKEAWSAAQLNDPNIVHIYAIGSLDQVRYIAMEYVQGINLREFIEKKGPPEVPLALSIMKQSGNAVRTAGEKGLIHRDIKPENIMITKRGQVKVADFGLCRLQNDDGSLTLTQDGVTMGTPLYMSPEQAQGLPLDHRSDLYSLGVTFYHMLAGEPPFRSESPIALALKHVKDVPPDLGARRPDLPADLCRLVMKLIAKAPADRYQSASEMLRELARIKESLHLAGAQSSQPVANFGNTEEPLRTLAGPAGSGSQATTVNSGGSIARTEAYEPPARRSAGALLPVAAILAVGIGAGVGWNGRAEDLLSPTRDETAHVPALWLEPGWSAIPKQPTALSQYRHALLHVPIHESVAAWVAVAGHHPESPERASQAFTQLGRELFRRGDAERLEIFSAELTKTGRSHDGKLAAILQVGSHVLRGDFDAVINNFGASFTRELADPALAELALEITTGALTNRESRDLTRTMSQSLLEIQRSLMMKMLEITIRDTWGRLLGF